MEKPKFFLIVLLIVYWTLFQVYDIRAQVAINNTGASPHGSAMLDIQSTEKGILVPRLTSVQRSNVSSPANGLLVLDTDTYSFWFFEGGTSGWVELKASNNNAERSDTDTDTKLKLREKLMTS